MTAIQDQPAVQARQSAQRDRTRERLDDLAWLIDGGVWPPTACARVGWTLTAAEKAARDRAPHLGVVLRRHVKAQRRAA